MFQAYRDLYKLDGKTALIAGGAGGIGSAIAEGLASLGAGVVVTSRTLEGAEKTAGAVRAAGGKAEGCALSVEDIACIAPVVDRIAQQHGSVDILVNCVGTHIEAPALEYREEDWDRIFDIDVKAAFFLSQAVAGHQVERGGGTHIHITSVRSQLGIHRGYVSYCAAKGSLVLMIRQLATEWARYRITVNGIAPTFTNTPLVAKYLDDPAFLEPLLKRIPLGRVCQPIDIAGLAMFLASPAGSFVTGQNIFIDGGVTATQ